MTAEDAEGTILTRPLQFSAGRLCANAKVDPGGYLQAEVVDAEGKTVPGYDASSCARVQGDMLRGPVAWNARTAVPRSDNGGHRISASGLRMQDYIPSGSSPPARRPVYCIIAPGT